MWISVLKSKLENLCKNKHESQNSEKKIKWKIIQIDALRELALWLPAVIYSYWCISSDFDQFRIETIDSANELILKFIVADRYVYYK